MSVLLTTVRYAPRVGRKMALRRADAVIVTESEIVIVHRVTTGPVLDVEAMKVSGAVVTEAGRILTEVVGMVTVETIAMTAVGIEAGGTVQIAPPKT